MTNYNNFNNNNYSNMSQPPYANPHNTNPNQKKNQSVSNANYNRTDSHYNRHRHALSMIISHLHDHPPPYQYSTNNNNNNNSNGNNNISSQKQQLPHSNSTCMITAESLAPFVCHMLSRCINNEKEGDGLWDKNQYFMQAITDFCRDLIYYVYVGGQSRKEYPKCLIGYYELIKNIIHMPTSTSISTNTPNITDSIKKQQQVMKNSKKSKLTQSQSRKSITQHSNNNNNNNSSIVQLSGVPRELQLYSQERLARLLMMDASFLYLRGQISKLQQSSQLCQMFISELSQVIGARSNYLFSLYYLSHPSSFSSAHHPVHQQQSHPISSYILAQLPSSLESSPALLSDTIANQSDLEQLLNQITIDMILLCIIYAVYRSQGFHVLMVDIVKKYQEIVQTKIDKDVMLTFYNQVFINSRIVPKQIIQNTKITHNPAKTLMVHHHHHQHHLNQQHHNNSNNKNNRDGHSKQQVQFRQSKEKGKIMDDEKQEIQKQKQQKNMRESIGMFLGSIRYEQVKQEKSIFDMFQ